MTKSSSSASYRADSKQGAPASTQGGVVLIFALIALLLLGIGAVGLIRSFDTSIVTAASIGFKRDLTNEGVFAFSQAKVWFSNSSQLGNYTTQQSDNATYGYFATLQSGANSYGIPAALMIKTPTAAYTFPSTAGTATGITVYSVIERLCSSGVVVATNVGCVLTKGATDQSGGLSPNPSGGNPLQVFRITVRVDGPHSTHAFLQQTFVS